MTYSNKKWYKPTKLSTKISFAAILILFIRLLANIPVPFINRDYLSILFADSSAFSLLNTFSGGAFTNMTFMALGVTPYITASIILQLLCITFPKLKDIQKEGNYDKNKWKVITIITGIGLGIIQSIGMAITLGSQGLFTSYNFTSVAVVSLLWVIGGTITILIGEYISKFCIGNGVSLILAANIIAALPRDIVSFWHVYVNNKSALDIVSAIVVFVFVVFLLISFTAVLTGAHKDIPIIYPSSRQSAYKNNSHIPMKLNSAGVMPVIFTSTLFSIPLMFISPNNTNPVASALYQISSGAYHYNFNSIYGIISIILNYVLVVLFAYFYTAITINTTELANKLRKKGACIPGIRPGQTTDEYLYKKIKYMTFIGATMLFVLTQIPMIITSFSSIGSLSISGTSIIIIVGVIMETALTIKAELAVKSYDNSNKLLFGMSAKSTAGYRS
ncbi:MAG: preprotein translocase subunit SecY [Bacilli bacterium]|nr:preprotein translocase subunit SecY [Bacilli bacterium]